MELSKSNDHLDQLIKELNSCGVRSKTLQRLREAGFFLLKMKETYVASVDFEYYWTAYIMIARSVSWIMKNEYSHIDGFNDWYKSKQLGSKFNSLSKKITKLRNTITKIEPLKYELECSITFNKNDIHGFGNVENMSPEELSNVLNKYYAGKKVKITKKDEINSTSDKMPHSYGKFKIEKIKHEYFTDIIQECTDYHFYLYVLALEVLCKFEKRLKKPCRCRVNSRNINRMVSP